jgi:hypothetical protein
MKQTSDPTDWSPAILIGIALTSVAGPAALIYARRPGLAFLAACTAFATWLLMGWRSNGFPYLFDTLALFVFLHSAWVMLLVTAKWLIG